MSTTQTPLMDLILPVVLDNLGPEYAQLINNALTRIDSHTHTTNNGNPIPSAGIGIDANLTFNQYAATMLKFINLVSAAGTATNQSIYMDVNGDLWWKNSTGASVQLTSGSALAVPGTGAITSKYIGAGPSYSITSADAQSVLLVTTSSSPQTLNLPAALGNNYAVCIKDYDGNGGTNNITIHPNGSDFLENVNADYIVNTNFGSVWLVSDNISRWSIF